MRKKTVLALSIAVFLSVSLPLLPKTSAQTTTNNTTNSFSPGTRTDFSWRPTSTIQKKGPLENYVENQAENIRIENYPTYAEVLRDENFANDNYSYVIENVPSDWIVKDNSTFVSYHPPGKPVWVWDMNVIQENVLGRFRKSGPASVYKIQFTVKPNDVTLAVEGAYDNLDASIFNSDYYYKRREADLTDISALENELEEIPVHASVGSFGNAVTRPITPPTWINDGASNKITLTINLNKRDPGYAYASGKFGSHSISWTVSSATDWWGNSDPSENDVRTTISNGSLMLTGENTRGWWSMDEFPSGFNDTDNTVYDLTSYQNDGTAENGPTIASGKWDNALSFDNTAEQFVQIPDDDSLDLIEDLTLMAWVYPDALTSDFGIITKGHSAFGDGYVNYALQYDGVENVEFVHNDGSWQVHDSGIDLTSGSWNFVAVTVDNSASEVHFWVDGTTSTVTLSGTLTATNNDLWIGAKAPDRGFVPGDLDEPKIVGRKLSDNEFRKIYNRTKPTSLTNSDLKTGMWTSKIWDSGATEAQQIENIEYGALVDANENVWWNVEATDTGENTGWFQDEDNLITQSELPNNVQGENFQVEYKLETDNSVHSPSIQDYTLNVEPGVPVLENMSKSNVHRENVSISLDVADPTGDDIDYVEFYDNSNDSLIENVTTTKSEPASYSITWTGLAENTTYNWYATAYDNRGGENSSIVSSFTTDPNWSPVTENVGPTDTLDNRKTKFVWDFSDNNDFPDTQENYEIEVGTDDNWANGAETWSTNLNSDNKYHEEILDLTDNTRYYYRIRTLDDNGAWSSWASDNFYLDISLVPSIDAPTDGEDVTVNYEYDLKSSVKYSGLENLIYEWDFDDGTTATGPNPTHAWGSAGTYDITLTVSEENTVTATDSITINVVSGGGGGGGGAAASGATWENPKAQEPGLAGIPKGLLLYPIFTLAGFTFQLWMGFGLLIAVSWAKDKKKLAGALFLLLIFLAINYGKFLMVAGS